MKIKNEYPPNFNMIQMYLPLGDSKPIFCYGDTIYNPFEQEVTKDLEIHEEVHQKQQGNNIEEWWGRYLAEPEFRLQQEIEAYGTQYAFVKQITHGELREWLKEKMAQALSGEMYGSIISYQKAESAIRNYAKNH